MQPSFGVKSAFLELYGASKSIATINKFHPQESYQYFCALSQNAFYFFQLGLILVEYNFKVIHTSWSHVVNNLHFSNQRLISFLCQLINCYRKLSLDFSMICGVFIDTLQRKMLHNPLHTLIFRSIQKY